MAELNREFLADRLTSRELLALLFVCESQRKRTLDQQDFGGGAMSVAWSEFLDRFAARLTKLPEEEQVYLLGSYLQSVEEVDIYSNTTLQSLLEEHRALLAKVTDALSQDPRFP